MAKSKKNNFAILSDIDSIRLRSGMFIGSNETPIHLLQEVIDNALDELLNNFATSVKIYVNYQTCEVTVEDNGRGMLQGIYQDGKNPALNGREIVDLICSKLFSSEKFSSVAYQKSVGLHGVGLVVVNALSECLYITIHNGKISTTYKFIDGNWVGKESISCKSLKGTTVFFKPDKKYFEKMAYDTSNILNRLKMFKYFYKDSNIEFNNESVSVESLLDIHKSFESKLPLIEFSNDNYHFALSYNLEETQSRNFGYVNLLPVNEGAHINFVLSVLKEVWQDVRKSTGFVFEKDDCLIGCSLLFSCYLTSPTFDSQIKNRLTITKQSMRDAIPGIEKKIYKVLMSSDYYNSFTKPLLLRFSEYRKSLKKLKIIDYIKEVMVYGEISEDGENILVNRNITNSKLLDCTSPNREETELYIVEGDSAGGSIKQSRDISKHAILPLRGKPLNVANLELKDILKNLEFQSLINAIGCGVHPIERPENIRYGKIILCADADVDGRNIEAILLGGFLKLFPQLVQLGKLYICEAPLFKQNNKYFWDIEDIDTEKKFQRFKGLGEMNSLEIYESMINPENRCLLQVKILDSQDSDYAFQLVSNSLTRKTMLTDIGLLEKN